VIVSLVPVRVFEDSTERGAVVRLQSSALAAPWRSFTESPKASVVTLVGILARNFGVRAIILPTTAGEAKKMKGRYQLWQVPHQRTETEVQKKGKELKLMSSLFFFRLRYFLARG
jgi:hypothetical protein